jgi:hypothetical protein
VRIVRACHASTLPKVHLDCLMYCLDNKGAGGLGWIQNGKGGCLRHRELDSVVLCWCTSKGMLSSVWDSVIEYCLYYSSFGVDTCWWWIWKVVDEIG